NILCFLYAFYVFTQLGARCEITAMGSIRNRQQPRALRGRILEKEEGLKPLDLSTGQSGSSNRILPLFPKQSCVTQINLVSTPSNKAHRTRVGSFVQVFARGVTFLYTHEEI
ncbi:MAG: hypothetical protein C4323_11285, partial [Mastigocladus sp. ERB_26_2]